MVLTQVNLINQLIISAYALEWSRFRLYHARNTTNFLFRSKFSFSLLTLLSYDF